MARSPPFHLTITNNMPLYQNFTEKGNCCALLLPQGESGEEEQSYRGIPSKYRPMGGILVN
jgi:hypothetical protein